MAIVNGVNDSCLTTNNHIDLCISKEEKEPRSISKYVNTSLESSSLPVCPSWFICHLLTVSLSGKLLEEVAAASLKVRRNQEEVVGLRE